jgi:alpha-tubulin suppressor-like RCC1 family protein
LWGWGYQNNGSLGLNDTVTRSSPVQVGALTTWYQVAAGNSISFATKTDGTMWSWGYNSSGQLGQNNTISRSSPVQVGLLTTWTTLPKMPMSQFCLAIKG